MAHAHRDSRQLFAQNAKLPDVQQLIPSANAFHVIFHRTQLAIGRVDWSLSSLG